MSKHTFQLAFALTLLAGQASGQPQAPVARSAPATKPASAPQAVQVSQGVNRNELVLGTIQDLSGPLASYGKHIRNGLQMRVDEANERGGVNGRKVRLIVEDSGNDPKKAAAAADKLVNQDRIFAMVGHGGTAQNMAAMPVQFEKDVLNFFPVAAAKEMYEPFHRLKYAFVATYFDQMRIAAPRLMKERKLSKPCALYQDDAFGQEILRGAEAGLKTIGSALVEKAPYERGTTDFAPQVAKMKAAGCDLVVLGTVIRETVSTLTEAQKAGFRPVFVGSVAMYTDLIVKLGGTAMEGLFATMTTQFPYPDVGEDGIRSWARKYRTKFGEDPIMQSAMGYGAMDAFLLTALRVGHNLSTDTFVGAMDKTTLPRDMFGRPELTFGPGKRLGNAYSRLSQIQNGRWTVVSDYVAFSGLRPALQKDGRWVIESEFFKD